MRLAILGIEEKTLELGRTAVRANVWVTGIHDFDHHAALLASLHLGCCAFPDPLEAARDADLIVVGGSFAESDLPPSLRERVVSLEEAAEALAKCSGSG